MCSFAIKMTISEILCKKYRSKYIKNKRVASFKPWNKICIAVEMLEICATVFFPVQITDEFSEGDNEVEVGDVSSNLVMGPRVFYFLLLYNWYNDSTQRAFILILRVRSFDPVSFLTLLSEIWPIHHYEECVSVWCNTFCHHLKGGNKFCVYIKIYIHTHRAFKS